MADRKSIFDKIKSFWVIAALLLLGSVIGASKTIWSAGNGLLCGIAPGSCGAFAGDVSDSPFADPNQSTDLKEFLSRWDQNTVSLDVYVEFSSQGVLDCPGLEEQSPNRFCLAETTFILDDHRLEFVDAQSNIGETYRLIGDFRVNERLSNGLGQSFTLFAQ